MIPPLTEEQSQAVATHTDEPLRLIDPKTNEVYVLLRADVYDRLRSLLEEDYDIQDTYAAQFASAMRAGWGDPAMADYDNYDEAYRKLCQSTEAKSS
jgi:hypothetical protein